MFLSRVMLPSLALSYCVVELGGATGQESPSSMITTFLVLGFPEEARVCSVLGSIWEGSISLLFLTSMFLSTQQSKHRHMRREDHPGHLTKRVSIMSFPETPLKLVSIVGPRPTNQPLLIVYLVIHFLWSTDASAVVTYSTQETSPMRKSRRKN